MKKLALSLLVFTVFLAPLLAGAVVTDSADPCQRKFSFDPGCVKIDAEQDLFGLIFKFLWLLRTLFWILAVFFLLFAAYKYLIGGASGKVDDAKKMIGYAVIAMIIALVATSIPFLVASILN